MCQVHTGAYFSRLAPEKPIKTPLATQDPGKTTTYLVYITRSTYHYAYARQTQVNWKKRNKQKKRRERKGKKMEEQKSKKIRNMKNM